MQAPGASDTRRGVETAPYGIIPPGFRLPVATRLGRVRLQIADLTRSLAYYQQVIGLRVLEQAPGRAVLGPQGDDTPLVELVERSGAHPVPRRGRLGLYHLAILLPERAALARFVTHLSELGERAGMSDHLVSEAVYLSDPDGLGIEVYADRPRAAWQHHDRQLLMTTAPLRVAELLRSTGGERWTGAPAGTVIGHLHLYVSEIARAADFYHRALGLDQVVWSYPGALFMSAGGYHHHLGTNTWAASAPLATEHDARLLDWTLVLPDAGSVAAAARNLTDAGYPVERTGPEAVVRDPWGTALRITTEPVGD